MLLPLVIGSIAPLLMNQGVDITYRAETLDATGAPQYQEFTARSAHCELKVLAWDTLSRPTPNRLAYQGNVRFSVNGWQYSSDSLDVESPQGLYDCTYSAPAVKAGMGE